MKQARQKDKDCIMCFCLYEVLRVVRCREVGSRMVFARDRGGRNQELPFNGYRLSVEEDKKKI